MINIDKDIEYKNIVKHILNNEKFDKIKEIEHHGVTRYEHSLKVSYYSYKIARALKLDYEDAARAGLLHDFFLSSQERTAKDRFLSTFKHPKIAVENAINEFGINSREEDIIKTHMFPINLSVPRYCESWLVSLVDKIIGINEFGHKFGYKASYIVNVYLLFLFNNIR